MAWTTTSGKRQGEDTTSNNIQIVQVYIQVGVDRGVSSDVIIGNATSAKFPTHAS